MARLVYVEPEEEITDLVGRIRDFHDEAEVVFVLPHRSTVLQSVLNLRLLQQYSRSFLRPSSIVTSDPRTQQLARDNGFPTFASVAAFERGVQAVPQPAPRGATLPDPDSEGRGPGLTPAAAAATAAAAARVPRQTPARVNRVASDRRRGLAIAAVALFVVGLLLLFLVAPTATVTVVLQATPVKEDNLTVQGTPDPTAASGPLKVLTVVAGADETAKVPFKATGQKNIAAAAATAQIVFSTDYVAPFCLRISKGSTLAESGSLKWVATDTPAYDTQCANNGVYVPGSPDGKFAPPSKPIGVTASSQGAAGNVPAGGINSPDPAINGCNPQNYPTPPPGGGPYQPPPACSPGDFRVTNPSAAGGGADQHTLTVVQDSDVAAFQAQLQQTTGSLTDKVKADMLAKAPGKTFAIDPGKSGLTLSQDLSPAVPASGDQAPATQDITVAEHGQGALYNPKEVRARLEERLRQDVQQTQADAILSDSGRVVGDPVVQQAGPDGVVVFSISGSGYAQPPVDYARLRDNFTGHSRDSVRQVVQAQFGKAVQDVQVAQTIPFFVLPLFSSRIDVSICVRSSNQTC